MISDWDLTTVGSRDSRRMIAIIAFVIGLSWLAAAIAASNSIEAVLKNYALGWHPYAEGPWWIHLLAYSFIHQLPWYLLWNVVALWVLVRIARGCVNPVGFIRLYSLGAISSGLIYLLVSWQLHNTSPLIGGGGALMCMLGALAVMKPSRGVWGWVLFVLVMQASNYESGPTLALSMTSGLVAGFIYGAIARIVSPRVRRADLYW